MIATRMRDATTAAVRWLWLRTRLWWIEMELSRLEGVQRGKWHYRHARAAIHLAAECAVLDVEIDELRRKLGLPARLPHIQAVTRPADLPRMRVVGGGR